VIKGGGKRANGNATMYFWAWKDKQLDKSDSNVSAKKISFYFPCEKEREKFSPYLTRIRLWPPFQKRN
jgi:hypothetical protein